MDCFAVIAAGRGNLYKKPTAGLLPYHFAERTHYTKHYSKFHWHRYDNVHVHLIKDAMQIITLYLMFYLSFPCILSALTGCNAIFCFVLNTFRTISVEFPKVSEIFMR